MSATDRVDATDHIRAAIATPRFRRLIERSRGAPEPPEEHCELCAEPVSSGHQHLLDLRSRELRCACRACAVLFDRRAAGGGVHRLVPDRCWYLPDLALDDTAWHSIPVGLAFLFHHSGQERVIALYPSPAGPTESALGPRAWAEMAAGNPVLGDMEADVEALLVNRARDAREQWLVPIDVCYALVGLVRTRWKGLGGGEEVWAAVDGFFADLRRRSRIVRADGARSPAADQEKEATWRVEERRFASDGRR